MGNLPIDRSGSKPTRVRFVVLAFVCTLGLITYLDRVCISRVQDPMKRELNLDDKQMGWIFSAFFLGYALFEIPGGWMGDVWGPRSVLGRIVLWWSGFTALTGCVWYFRAPDSFQLWIGGYPLLSAFGVLLLVRFLFGAGEAGAFPNINRVTGTWFPARERGAAQGAVWMCARLGGALAPAVTGALYLAVGWRQAFWALGVLGLVWSVVFLVWFRDRPEQVAACNDAELDHIRQGGAGAPQAAHAWPPLSLLLSSVSVWATCLAAFGVCFNFSFYPTVQPNYYKEVFGLSPDTKLSELLTGLPYFCGAAGALIGGWLSDRLIRRTGSRRWGRSLVGMAGFGSAGVCALAACFATQTWQAATLLCLCLFLSDLAIPNIWAAMAEIGGRYVGTVSGLSNMVGNIGGAISPVLFPYIFAVLQALPAYAVVELTSGGDPVEHLRLQQLHATGRWQFIFAGMAAVWFMSAAAWLFIDAGKSLDESL